MKRRFLNWILILTLAAAGATARAQTKASGAKKPSPPPRETLESRSKAAREEVVKTAQEYKASLQKLLELQERDVKEKSEMVAKRKDLVEKQIISKLELQKGEQELAAAQAKANETRKQMGESDDLIAEVRAAEQLEKMPRVKVGAYQTTAALIRFNGPTRWVLSDASKVEGFFRARFNRSLPISAFGQTAVHNRLNFDHSNSMDVAVHPDSAEGQALMAYLRNAGIPFIAFRQAVPGSATGAHIHVGYPSHRIH